MMSSVRRTLLLARRRPPPTRLLWSTQGGRLLATSTSSNSAAGSSKSRFSTQTAAAVVDEDETNNGEEQEVPSPQLELPLDDLKYLEEEALRVQYAALKPDNMKWEEFKALVDEAATPVDKRVRPIYATLTLSFVAQGIQFPVLPQLARSLELSTSDLGLVSSATALARLLMNAPATALAERVGRRPLLIAGPATAAVGVAGLSLSSCFEHLVCSNLCVGSGLSMTMAGASLYLSDVSTPKNRAQSTAPILQSALLGFAIGPAIGGVLNENLGASMPFALCAGGLAASSLASAVLLPETVHEVTKRAAGQKQQEQQQQQEPEQQQQQPPAQASKRSMVMTLLRRPALQGIGVHVFMNGFSQGAFPVTLVLFAVEHMQMSSSMVGGMLTANVAVMVLTTQPATKLSDRVESRKLLMVPAIGAAAAFTGMQPFCTDATQFALMVGITGFCQAIAMPSISPLILDNTTEAERSSALAGRQIAQDSGTLLGASSMGLVASLYGIPAAMQTVALLQAASVLLFWQRVPTLPLGSTSGSSHNRSPDVDEK